MALKTTVPPRHVASILLLSALTACDNTTGGYPPPPPPYVAPMGAIEAAKEPKFKPLVQALIAQRKAAAALASDGSGDPKRAQELFGKSREAAKAVGDAVAAAQLTDEEKRTWNEVTSFDDATLAELAR